MLRQPFGKPCGSHRHEPLLYLISGNSGKTQDISNIGSPDASLGDAEDQFGKQVTILDLSVFQQDTGPGNICRRLPRAGGQPVEHKGLLDAYHDIPRMKIKVTQLFIIREEQKPVDDFLFFAFRKLFDPSDFLTQLFLDRQNTVYLLFCVSLREALQAFFRLSKAERGWSRSCGTGPVLQPVRTGYRLFRRIGQGGVLSAYARKPFCTARVTFHSFMIPLCGKPSRNNLRTVTSV